MESFEKWFKLMSPTGWEDVIVRAVKVLVVAFVMFHLKEWLDAGRFDTPDILIDSVWVAGGTLVLNTILLWVKR